MPAKSWVSARSSMADVLEPSLANKLLVDTCPKEYPHLARGEVTKLLDQDTGDLVALWIPNGWKRMYPKNSEREAN